MQKFGSKKEMSDFRKNKNICNKKKKKNLIKINVTNYIWTGHRLEGSDFISHTFCLFINFFYYYQQSKQIVTLSLSHLPRVHIPWFSSFSPYSPFTRVYFFGGTLIFVFSLNLLCPAHFDFVLLHNNTFVLST